MTKGVGTGPVQYGMVTVSVAGFGRTQSTLTPVLRKMRSAVAQSIFGSSAFLSMRAEVLVTARETAMAGMRMLLRRMLDGRAWGVGPTTVRDADGGASKARACLGREEERQEGRRHWPFGVERAPLLLRPSISEHARLACACERQRGGPSRGDGNSRFRSEEEASDILSSFLCQASCIPTRIAPDRCPGPSELSLSTLASGKPPVDPHSELKWPSKSFFKEPKCD